ncbi:MAG: TIGR03016 family PEP-CTERM system-associated outer membrane protein [Pseudomonadota bacterium]
MVNTASSKLPGALLCLLCAGQAQAGDWKFSPKVTLLERYTDNVTLVDAGKEASFITEVTPGFTLARKSARARVDIDYGLQGLLYSHDTDASTLNNQLTSKAYLELLEDHFFLDVNARVGQQSTSLLGRVGPDNYSLTGTGTRSEVRTLGVAPSWRSRIGSMAQFDARWQLSYSDSDNSAALSSTRGSNLSLGLSSGSAFHKTPWGLNYRIQHNDGTQTTRLSSLTGNVGYRVTPKVLMTLVVGNDDNNRQGVGTFNQASGTFWTVGGSWAPTTRTKLDATAGHRYNAQTFGLNFAHKTRKTNWALRYSEDVMNVYSQLNDLAAFDVYLCSGVEVPVPQGIAPPDPACVGPQPAFLPVPSLINDVSLNKTWSGSVTWLLGKSTLTGSLNQSRREVLATGVSDDRYSLSGNWNWRLNSRMTSNLILSSTQANASTNGTDTWSIGWVLSRKLSPDATGSVEVRHYEGTSNTAGEYKENSASVRLNMNF